MTDSSAAEEESLQRRVSSVPRHVAETVILVHGLWTPALVFALHAHWLQQRGYRVLRFGYRSVWATLAQNAQELKRFIAATSGMQIQLVGHSLGGLLILEMLAQAQDPRLRRVVLLGTPCLGNHCARRLAGMAGMPALLGRSIMEWLSRPDLAVPRSAVEVGVLAGTRSIGLGRVLSGLPRPNDGVVALAETRFPGAADFIALPIAHSQMLVSRPCALQIASFLECGHFLHAEEV